MTRPDALIFDLDGTLWDSTDSVCQAWNRVLVRNRPIRSPLLPSDIARIMGKSHVEIWKTLFADLDAHSWEALSRECYAEEERVIRAQGGELYRGVGEGVSQLSRVYRLFIVSNCQQGYIESFLAWSGYQAHFKDYECYGNTGEDKGRNLARLILRNQLRAPVYIGDTEGDQSAAEAAHVPFYHARYGFGQIAGGAPGFDGFAELTGYFLSLSD